MTVSAHDKQAEKILRQIAELQAAQLEVVLDIRKIAAGALVVLENISSELLNQPSGIRVIQLDGGISMSVNGIQAGGPAGVFAETPTPSGSAFPAGTTFTWAADDTNVVLTPSADTTQVSAQTPANDAATSFNLTCTSSFTPPGASAPVSGSVQVPILPAVAQTPTGLTINQVS